MTRAVIHRLKNGNVKGFSVKGHAGAAKKGEYDMVCAGISAVCYTALGGLEELCGVNTFEERDGSLTMNLPEAMTTDNWATAQIILETMYIGLKQIENKYTRHIHVSIKEV